MTATATVPATLADAVAQMHTRLAEYEKAQRQFTTSLTRYADHDALSSRMRIAAIDNLMKRGMNKTDAKDSPRLDPDYAAHGDELTRLGNQKAEAEADLYSAKAKLEVAIATARALTAGQGEIGS